MKMRRKWYKNIYFKQQNKNKEEEKLLLKSFKLLWKKILLLNSYGDGKSYIIIIIIQI